MTVTKIKPPSSKPIGVSFSHRYHNLRWGSRLKYVAARISITVKPLTFLQIIKWRDRELVKSAR